MRCSNLGRIYTKALHIHRSRNVGGSMANVGSLPHHKTMPSASKACSSFKEGLPKPGAILHRKSSEYECTHTQLGQQVGKVVNFGGTRCLLAVQITTDSVVSQGTRYCQAQPGCQVSILYDQCQLVRLSPSRPRTPSASTRCSSRRSYIRT